MSEVIERAEEKLLASITKSQASGSTGESKPKATTKKSTTAKKKPSPSSSASSASGKAPSAPANLETRNRFVGRLRWPD